MSCADVLAVSPARMRRLALDWEDAAATVRTQATTIADVAHSGIGDLGRINQFLVPVLGGFLLTAERAAVECADSLDDAAAATRAVGEEIREVDEEIAAQLRAPRSVVRGVMA